MERGGGGCWCLQKVCRASESPAVLYIQDQLCTLPTHICPPPLASLSDCLNLKRRYNCSYNCTIVRVCTTFERIGQHDSMHWSKNKSLYCNKLNYCADHRTFVTMCHHNFFDFTQPSTSFTTVALTRYNIINSVKLKQQLSYDGAQPPPYTSLSNMLPISEEKTFKQNYIIGIYKIRFFLAS